jgi:acyl-CoA reductase-like NAD-dependent aldehyde dehydrogenase
VTNPAIGGALSSVPKFGAAEARGAVAAAKAALAAWSSLNA